jgi:ribulose-5-phosphate 4-epimerase/fuculose-1-phosphate aldolase
VPSFQDARVEVVRAAQFLYQRGFLSATGGNVSLRIAEANALAITPSDYDYRKMLPEDICVLGMDLTPLEGPRDGGRGSLAQQPLKPSIESAMHSAIYQVRPDVQAVIHTHQVYTSTLATINAPIPALFDEQVRFLGRSVEIIPYRPSGTGMLKKQVARHVRNNANAYMMANHGALVFGTSMESAIHNVEILEKCALAYLLALCTEKKVGKVPLLVREVAFAKLRADQKRAAETSSPSSPER